MSKALKRFIKKIFTDYRYEQGTPLAKLSEEVFRLKEELREIKQKLPK